MNNKIIFNLVSMFLLVVFMLNLAIVNAASDICSVELASCELTNLTIKQISSVDANLTEENICIYFFYGKGCPHCAKVEPFLQELLKKYPDVSLKSYEIYFNNTNYEFFQDFNKRYDIKLAGVPSVFIGDRALVGETAIKNNLEASITYFQKNKPICPEKYNKIEATHQQVSPTKNIKLTLPVVVIAALVDSINPCAFSVLIFLLVYLLSLGARRRILKVGLTYITVVFIVYFFSGLGLFAVVQTTGLTRIIYTTSATIAIVAGLINVKDFFWYGKGISLAIPESKKPLLQKYIQKASIPAAIVLGILVSIFELPCTGGVYLAILSLLSSKMTLLQGIPYLLLYNLIFVLPLIIILLIVYKGIPPEKVEHWRISKKKWLRLIIGIIMILLGIVMLLGWI